MFAQGDFYGNNPAAVGLCTQREVRPKSERDLLQASITQRCCLFCSSALWTDCVSPWRAHLIHLLVSSSRHVVVWQRAGCQGKCRASAECRRSPSSVLDTRNHQCRPRLARPGHVGGVVFTLSF